MAESNSSDSVSNVAIYPAAAWGWVVETQPEPEDPPMTDDKTALRDLLEKGSDATFLREMIGLLPNG